MFIVFDGLLSCSVSPVLLLPQVLLSARAIVELSCEVKCDCGFVWGKAGVQLSALCVSGSMIGVICLHTS